MPSTLSIKPSTLKLQIDRGGQHRETVTLTKSNSAFVGYSGEAEPPEYRKWVEMSPDSLALMPLTSTKVQLTIEVPNDAPYTKHQFRVEFVAEKHHTDTAGVDIEVEVQRWSWLRRNWWWIVVAILIVVAVAVAFKSAGV